MKKLSLLLLIIFMLAGCQSNLYIEESTEAYEALSREFDQYLQHDIAQDTKFQIFINQVTLETATSGMMIEVRIYSLLGALTEVKQFSGVIIDEDEHYHILTIYEPFILETGETLTISLNDYLGNTLSAELAYFDDTLNLAILTTQRRTVNYESIKIKEQAPMQGEPLVLIGFQRQIINAMTMGMMLPLDEQTDDTYLTTILSDDFGLGGAIIDSTFQLVGIQIYAHDDYTEFIKTDIILSFYQSYLED